MNGLVEIDDVDAVALGKDVGLHLRIPAFGLVTEVNAGLEQRLHHVVRRKSKSAIRHARTSNGVASSARFILNLTGFALSPAHQGQSARVLNKTRQGAGPPATIPAMARETNNPARLRDFLNLG